MGSTKLKKTPDLLNEQMVLVVHKVENCQVELALLRRSGFAEASRNQFQRMIFILIRLRQAQADSSLIKVVIQTDAR
jgi:hypothetical protein